MKSPTGSPIIATLESIPGSCGIFFADDNSWEYDGNGTDVGWDGQETVQLAGQNVYLDERGNEWLESQLIPDDAEAQTTVPPWYTDETLRRVEIENTLKELFHRVTGEQVDLTSWLSRPAWVRNAINNLMMATEPKP